MNRVIQFQIFLTCLFAFIGIQQLRAQQINAQVVDAANGKSLAFVNVVFDQSKMGTVSDIDGYFVLNSNPLPKKIRLSYVGYFDTTVDVSSLKAKNSILPMKSKTTDLQEVVIFSQENPAHRIILNTIENRKRNNPENLNAFRYQAYHKMVFTMDNKPKTDTAKVTMVGVSFVDSAGSKIDSFFESQHLFLMESVSERIFKSPDKSYEKILGAKVSGMQDPFLVTLAQSMQSFSFYSNRIALFDKWYVNPISPGSTSKYFFHIEDTLYSAADTVFVISFRPLKNTKFDGMKGLLYINTQAYAIQNVIAEPAKKSNELSIKIQQKYERINDSAWFPVQLNTDLIFNKVNINDRSMIGIGRSYLKNIEINPDIRNREFGAAQLEIADNANKKDSLYWSLNRTVRIDSLDERTYSFNDSLGKEIHLDAKMKAFKILTSGFIPLGPVKIDLNSLIGYNIYEGFRFGMGLYSSEKLIKWMNFGGYFAYGLKDSAWKYGFSADLRLNKKSNSFLKLGYSNDLNEPAEQKNFSLKKDNPRLSYRFLLINPLFWSERYFVSFRSRIYRGISTETGFNYANHSIKSSYGFALSNENSSVLRSSFSSAEAFIGFRWAHNEKIIRTANDETNLGTNFPILTIRYTHGFSNVYYSEFDFNRMDVELKKSFAINYVGRSNFLIRAGYIDKALPYYMLYNGIGSKLNFFIHTPNSFASMKTNEFLHNEYIEMFYAHNFGKILPSTKNFKPELEFVFNALYGRLLTPEVHRYIEFKSATKGFFESGILINNLLISNFSSIGVGMFYRIGAYAYVHEKDNFVFVTSLKSSF